MATENISIIMLERMWELLSGIVADKTGTADAKLEAAIAAANGVENPRQLVPGQLLDLSLQAPRLPF